MRIVVALEVIFVRNILTQLVAIEHAHMRIVIALGQFFGQLRRVTDIGLLVDGFDLAVLQVAINGVLFDAFSNLCFACFRKIP